MSYRRFIDVETTSCVYWKDFMGLNFNRFKPFLWYMFGHFSKNSSIKSAKWCCQTKNFIFYIWVVVNTTNIIKSWIVCYYLFTCRRYDFLLVTEIILMIWQDIYATKFLLVQHHFANYFCHLEFHILHFGVQKKKNMTNVCKKRSFWNFKIWQNYSPSTSTLHWPSQKLHVQS